MNIWYASRADVINHLRNHSHTESGRQVSPVSFYTSLWRTLLSIPAMAQLSNAFFRHSRGPKYVPASTGCWFNVTKPTQSPSGSVNSVVLSVRVEGMAGLHGFVLEFSPVVIWWRVWEDEMFEMRPRLATMTGVSKRLWMACSIIKFSSCLCPIWLFLSLFSHKRIVLNFRSHMFLNAEIKK